MAAQASSSTRSCNGAIERYQNCQCGLNLLSYRLVVSRAFAREGEWVVVCVESIFFSRWTRLSLLERITTCKTIIFSQASANDKILRHEGV